MALTVVVVAAAALGLPIPHASVPVRVGAAVTALLVLGTLIGVVGSIMGHSIMSLADVVKRRLVKAHLVAQLLVISLSLAVCVGTIWSVGAVLIPHRAGVTDMTIPQEIYLTNSAEPYAVRPGVRGSVWVADFRDTALTSIDAQGHVRQVPIPKTAADNTPVDNSPPEVTEFAPDARDNVWTLASGVGGMDLIGLSPATGEIADYAVSGTTDLVVDHAQSAWMVEDPYQSPLVVDQVDLASGKVTRYEPFGDAGIGGSGDVSLRVDTGGNLWILGRTHDAKAGLGFLAAERLSGAAHFVQKPVHWPKALGIPVTDTTFTVDRLGSLWISYVHGLARVDGRGVVHTYPMYQFMEVLDVSTLPDGNLAFIAALDKDEGAVISSALNKSKPWVYVATFDPTKNVYPRYRRVIGAEPFSPSVAGGPNRSLVVPERDKHSVTYLPELPPTIPDVPIDQIKSIETISSALYSAVRQVEVGHADATWRQVVVKLAGLIENARRQLSALASHSSELPDPRLSKTISQVATEMSSVESMLPDLEKADSTAAGYFYTYGILRGRAMIGLNELRQMVHLTPLTRSGRSVWEPTVTPDLN